MEKIKHFIRAHLGTAIAAVAGAVVLVGGVLILTTAGGATTTPAPAGVSAPSTTTTTAPPRGAHRHPGVRGHVTAIAATTWTLTSAHGATVTVQVTPRTAFGPKSAPLAASNFSVGDIVVVTGAPAADGTVVATRIAKPRAANTAPTTTPTTAPTTVP